MNAGAKPNDALSLDDLFPTPTRQQWVELTLSGLKREASDTQALQDIRRSTLEGIPFEVLYDTCDPTPLANRSRSEKRQCDNRISVNCHNLTNTSSRILRALGGGITSVEIHTQTPSDLATALCRVQLDIAQVSLRSGHAYAACTQEYKTICNAQNLAEHTLTFSANADPVSTALTSGCSKSALSTELQRAAQFAKLLTGRYPKAHGMLVDAALHHNAGASTVEELHAALATATLYLEAMLQAGMSAPEASRHIIFQLAMDTDVLLGIAKIRALRALWQQVLGHFNVVGYRADSATIVAETSLRFHSKLECWNNHLRNLCASKAAMVGNVDTIIVHPHDTLLRSSECSLDETDIGDRMARNMAIILERECGLLKVNDPMAGSYAIENLTQQFMQYTWDSLGSTDTGEGWIDELLSGRWKKRLQTTQHHRVQLMREEKQITVGVNRFVQQDNPINTTADIAVPYSNAASTDAQKITLLPVRDAEAFEQAATSGVST